MPLEGIHLFFKKIAAFQLKYRWLCLALLAAVTVVGLIGIKSFKVGSSDEEDLISVRELTKQNDARFKELFGSNDSIVLLFESDDVFKPETLQAIKDIGSELLEKVPYSDSITSITDTDITVGTDGRYRNHQAISGRYSFRSCCITSCKGFYPFAQVAYYCGVYSGVIQN